MHMIEERTPVGTGEIHMRCTCGWSRTGTPKYIEIQWNLHWLKGMSPDPKTGA